MALTMMAKFSGFGWRKAVFGHLLQKESNQVLKFDATTTAAATTKTTRTTTTITTATTMTAAASKLNLDKIGPDRSLCEYMIRLEWVCLFDS